MTTIDPELWVLVHGGLEGVIPMMPVTAQWDLLWTAWDMGIKPNEGMIHPNDSAKIQFLRDLDLRDLAKKDPGAPKRVVEYMDDVGRLLEGLSSVTSPLRFHRQWPGKSYDYGESVGTYPKEVYGRWSVPEAQALAERDLQNWLGKEMTLVSMDHQPGLDTDAGWAAVEWDSPFDLPRVRVDGQVSLQHHTALAPLWFGTVTKGPAPAVRKSTASHDPQPGDVVQFTPWTYATLRIHVQPFLEEQTRLGDEVVPAIEQRVYDWVTAHLEDLEEQA